MNRLAPTVSKPLEPPSGGSSLTLISTPSSSRRLLRYSRRLRRRIVMTPFWSPSFLRAATIMLERSSSSSVLAAAEGCFSCSGGISPELIWLSTFCQRSAVSTVSTFRESLSIRKWPFCLSGPWQETQFSLKSCRCLSARRTSGASSAARAADAKRTGSRSFMRRRGPKGAVGVSIGVSTPQRMTTPEVGLFLIPPRNSAS